MKQWLQILGGGLLFGGLTAAGIAAATRSAQVGFHAGFWLGLVFALWLESRHSTQP